MDHPCAFVKVDPVFFSQPYHHFTSLSFILLKTLLTKNKRKKLMISAFLIYIMLYMYLSVSTVLFRGLGKCIRFPYKTTVCTAK